MVELLKQPLHQTFSVADQVISLYAGVNGYLDDIYLADVARFEQELLEYARTDGGELYETIARTGELTDRTEAALAETVETFKSGFRGRRRSEVEHEGPTE